MPRFSANISMLFRERPLLERFAAARAAGFAAVEIQFPYDTPLPELVRAKEEAGVLVDLINLPAGDFATGVRGIAALPDRASEFRDGVARGRDYARALGVKKVNVLAGIMPKDAKRADCLAQLAENLRFAAAALNGDGVRVLTEPINAHDVPGFLLNLTPDALAVVELAVAGTARDIAVQADLYHMERMGEELPAALTKLGRRLGHIQFADVPGSIGAGSSPPSTAPAMPASAPPSTTRRGAPRRPSPGSRKRPDRRGTRGRRPGTVRRRASFAYEEASCEEVYFG